MATTTSRPRAVTTGTTASSPWSWPTVNASCAVRARSTAAAVSAPSGAWLPSSCPPGSTTTTSGPRELRSATVRDSVPVSSRVATRVATLCACSRARVVPRSSAMFAMRKQSGTMNATTTADVVAATSHAMRRAISPRRRRCPRVRPGARRPHARCAGTPGERPSRRACGAATTGARRRCAPRRRRAGSTPPRGSRACVTTSPARWASSSSRSNSRRDSSRSRPASVQWRPTASTTRSPTVSGSSGSSDAGAAQHRADPRLELVHAEGLDDVVVGAGVQGLHDRGVVVARGHHDDRRAAHGAQHREQAVPVEVGQAQVEQHEVGLLVEGVLQADHPRGGARDRVPAVGERADERGADPGVVLDDQHVCHSGHARAGRG